jgi:hypothetical protein
MRLSIPSNEYVTLNLAYSNKKCVIPKRGIIRYNQGLEGFTRVEVAYANGDIKRYLVRESLDEIQHDITSRLAWELSNDR